jgi:hypothetical protein
MEEINTENIDIIFKESPKTFMEILKVHNREVQVANALAFFFRPKEKHGLNTLFIDALLKTNCSELKTFIPKKESSLVELNGYCNKPNEDLKYNVDEVEVFVEYPTENKNRIDILINTDSFTICIEFKINHDLDNPLEDYRDFILKKANNKRIYFIVLTPYKKDPIGEAKKFFNENSEFKQVVLSHFFKKISEGLLELQYTNDFKTNQYYQYFQDFAQTIKNREIRSKRHKALMDLKEKINNNHICDLHPKGFLEIKKKGYDLKIRLIQESITSAINPGWQIEKWVRNKEKEILKKLNHQVTLDEVFEEIKNH